MKLKKIFTVLSCVSFFSMVVGCSSTPKHTHTMTHHDAVQNSCTEAGSIEYWSCSGCSKNFSDEKGEAEVTNIVVPAAGHKGVHHEAVPGADCQHKGTIEYWECSACEKKFSDAECKQQIASIEGSLGNHLLSHHEAVPGADCQHKGTIEYWDCSVCSKKFSDAQGKTEISSIEGSLGNHSLSHHEATAATCETAGNTEYYSCDVSGCGKFFSDAEATTEVAENSWVIGALDHDMDTEWDADDNNHWHACKRNNCTHVEDLAAHTFEYQFEDEKVYKVCSVCFACIDLGEVTNLTFDIDYASNDGFHYSTSSAHPLTVGATLTVLNPSDINTNVAGLGKISVRTDKIISFWNLSLVAGSYVAFNGRLLVQDGSTYYTLTFKCGQARTANNTTNKIQTQMKFKAFREYNEHMMVDINCTDLGHGNGTNMAWTLGEAGRHTYWMVTLTRDGVTSDISAVPTTRGGAFGPYFKGIQFYNNDGYFIRVDFDKNALQNGDLITIKAGTMFSSASSTIDVIVNDINLKFDGSFVCYDIHSSAKPTTVEHWNEIGQIRFDGLNFMEPYEANTSYPLAFVRGVKYQVAGSDPVDATDFSANYWNKAGTLNGLWLHSVNGGVYGNGDRIIFENGASFMLVIGDANYNGRYYIDNGFALEFNGTSWNLVE